MCSDRAFCLTVPVNSFLYAHGTAGGVIDNRPSSAQLGNACTSRPHVLVSGGLVDRRMIPDGPASRNASSRPGSAFSAARTVRAWFACPAGLSPRLENHRDPVLAQQRRESGWTDHLRSTYDYESRDWLTNALCAARRGGLSVSGFSLFALFSLAERRRAPLLRERVRRILTSGNSCPQKPGVHNRTRTSFRSSTTRHIPC